VLNERHIQDSKVQAPTLVNAVHHARRMQMCERLRLIAALLLAEAIPALQQ
jgi:hypothetical protein